MVAFGRSSASAVHGRLRQAVYYWARVAAQRAPVSRGKYLALRARGHGHARALRSVADQLLNVACAMLRDGTCNKKGGVAPSTCTLSCGAPTRQARRGQRGRRRTA